MYLNCTLFMYTSLPPSLPPSLPLSLPPSPPSLPSLPPSLPVSLRDVKDVQDPLSKVEAGLQASGADVPLQSVHVRAQLIDLAAKVNNSTSTSAMHNIIANEQSGVECACACVLHVVQNCVVAYFRIT